MSVRPASACFALQWRLPAGSVCRGQQPTVKLAAVPGCRLASHQAAQQKQEEEEEEQSPLDRTAALLATDLTHAFLKVRKPMDALELYHPEIVLEESED